MVNCPLAQTPPPRIRFLFIGSGFYLFLPPDPGSLRAPLDLVSGSQDLGPQGTFTPKFIALAGRTIATPAQLKSRAGVADFKTLKIKFTSKSLGLASTQQGRGSRS